MTSAVLLPFSPSHTNACSAHYPFSSPKQFLHNRSSIRGFDFSKISHSLTNRFGSEESPVSGAPGHRQFLGSNRLSTVSSSEPDVAENGQNSLSPSPPGDQDEDSLPTMDDIIATAAQQGLNLEVSSLGPTFRIQVSRLDGTPFGYADGWIIPWINGNILHLESVKLVRGVSKEVDNVFGAGFFVGASTLRYGLDEGCQTAELLAIYDDEETHAKLVKYYSRLGFKPLYEVNEEDWKYFVDRVVWGGIGTRMNADCEELLRKWSRVLKPKAEAKRIWTRKSKTQR